MSTPKRLRICRVVTVPTTFDTLLREQILTIHRHHDLTLVCNFDGSDTQQRLEQKGIKTYSLGFSRSITPLQDVVTIAKLVRFLRKSRFHVVHSSTPKAGIVGMLSAWMSRTPRRIHTYTGQIWINLSGVKRWIFLNIDRLIATLATDVYADSVSQKNLLVEQRVTSERSIKVIGQGSISGVDLKRFDAEAFTTAQLRQLRSKMNISETAVVLAFVGRVGPEKGIVELVCAFLELKKDFDLHLLIIGPMEQAREQFPSETMAQIEACDKIVCTGYESHPEQYLAISDIFCLPSYREGFGSVVIEAGAMGLPVVGTRISGLVDAVVDNETGILIEPRNTAQLTSALRLLIQDSDLRARMGCAGRRRAREHFASDIINNAVSDAYTCGNSVSVE